MATDPVCEMRVEESKAAAIASHAGRTYYFCSAHCKVIFERAPETYVHPAIGPRQDDRTWAVRVTTNGS